MKLDTPTVADLSNMNHTHSASGSSGGALSGYAPAFVSGAANYFWATPNGSAGVPSLRAIVAADIPALNYAPNITYVTPTTLSNVSLQGDFTTVGSSAGFGFNRLYTTADSQIYCDFTHSTGAVLWFRQGSSLGNNVDTVTLDCLNNAVNAIVPMWVRASSFKFLNGPMTFTAYGAGVATFSASGVISSTATTGTGSAVLADSPTLTGNAAIAKQNGGRVLFYDINVSSAAAHVITLPESMDVVGALVVVGALLQNVGARTGLYVIAGYGDVVTTITAIDVLTVTANTSSGTITFTSNNANSLTSRVKILL